MRSWQATAEPPKACKDTWKPRRKAIPAKKTKTNGSHMITNFLGGDLQQLDAPPKGSSAAKTRTALRLLNNLRLPGKTLALHLHARMRACVHAHAHTLLFVNRNHWVFKCTHSSVPHSGHQVIRGSSHRSDWASMRRRPSPTGGSALGQTPPSRHLAHGRNADRWWGRLHRANPNTATGHNLESSQEIFPFAHV